MINGRITLLKLLGEGRNKVFLCEDKFFPSQQYAIKILPSKISKEEERAFFQEYDLLKKFSHPNIVKAHEAGKIIGMSAEDEAFGVEKGNHFILLEYYEGNSLLEIDFKANPSLLLKVIGQISSFLSYLHLANYIYFDLKFENILCSQRGNDIEIKILDFGFVQRTDNGSQNVRRGTAYYIAPEIIQNQHIDSRADLYSFGILLYRLVYGIFPCSEVDELKIYQSHLEEEYKFPASSYFSAAIIEVISQLLNKVPAKRIQSALQLYYALHLPLENYYLNLISATQFIGRKNDLAVIVEYIENKERNDILVLQGIQNSGKSLLAEKVAGEFQNTVLLDRLPSQKPGLVLQYIASRMVFSSFMHDEEVEKGVDLSHLVNENVDLNRETVIFIFTEICKAKNFILLFDDFNLLDEVVKEMLYHVLPVLQVNGCKIIILEDQTGVSSVEAIPNRTEYQLSTLLHEEIPIFLKKNFAGYFPQKQVAPLIEKFADLFPGNILLFLNELIAERILIFSAETIYVDTEKAKLFSGALQSVIFEKRISHLSSNEKEALALLSCIEAELNLDQTKTILKEYKNEADKILLGLHKKNLIRMPGRNSFAQLIASGLKLYVYSNITDKVILHKKIASLLKHLPHISPNEISRHFELAEEYDEAYLCLKTEIVRASELSAYIYLTKILTRLFKLPLSKIFAIEVRKKFVQILRQTGNNELALQIIDELESVYKLKLDRELITQKGIFLIASGEVETGKKLLIKQATKLTDGNDKTEILLEIANANLNKNLYNDVKKILDRLLEADDLTHEQKGKVFNMNGLLELYKNNNTDKAFSFFNMALNEFTNANLKQRIARVQVNLGNICSMKGDLAGAEQYWRKSLSINNAIGDLEQEALVLMNYGIYLFDTANYEKAIDLYKSAKNIFQTIGKKNGLGLALLNSGETYLITCEYSFAIDEFLRAVDIFRSTENEEEEASAYYLLAKTFAVIGDFEKTGYYTERYQKLSSDATLGEKHLLQLKFIKTLTDFYFVDITTKPENEELLALCSSLLETDNKYDTVLVSLIYVDSCIEAKEFQSAFSFLMSEKYLKLCTVNEIYQAVRLYLLGEVAIHFRLGNQPFVEYFTEAYTIIKEQQITEFTWIILYALANVYFKRNLFSKAEEFFNLTEGLIVFFSRNISDDSLKQVYLLKKERREVLRFIKNSFLTL